MLTFSVAGFCYNRSYVSALRRQTNKLVGLPSLWHPSYKNAAFVFLSRVSALNTNTLCFCVIHNLWPSLVQSPIVSCNIFTILKCCSQSKIERWSKANGKIPISYENWKCMNGLDSGLFNEQKLGWHQILKPLYQDHREREKVGPVLTVDSHHRCPFSTGSIVASKLYQMRAVQRDHPSLETTFLSHNRCLDVEVWPKSAKILKKVHGVFT